MLKKIKSFVIKNWLYITILSFLAVLVLVLLLFMKEDGSIVDPETPSDFNGIGEDVDPDVFHTSDFLSVEQPLSYHRNYTVEFEADIIQEINSNEKEYPGFQISDIDRVPLVENFIESSPLRNLEHSYEAVGLANELGVHSWSGTGTLILYDTFRNNVFMEFEDPILLRQMQFRPVDRISIHDAIGEFLNEYFGLNTDYDVKAVLAEGENYRIEFARLLNGLPIYREIGYDHILISPEGYLKEANFIIAGFHRYLGFDYELISGTELSRRISDLKYPKNVNFDILDWEVQERYEPYGYHMSADLFNQEGTIKINSKELVYLYSNSDNIVVVPTFMFTGEGYVKIDDENVAAEFLVLASAIDFEYVYVHPQSFFDLLE